MHNDAVRALRTRKTKIRPAKYIGTDLMRRATLLSPLFFLRQMQALGLSVCLRYVCFQCSSLSSQVEYPIATHVGNVLFPPHSHHFECLATMFVCASRFVKFRSCKFAYASCLR